MAWPDPPLPGELVRLPLRLPPVLVEAFGYEGGGHYVAFWWSPPDETVRWSDGGTSASGYWLPWHELLGHPVGRRVLGPFDLGSGASGGRHRLLADRWDEALFVGLPEDVDALLATQPSPIAMAVDAVGEEEVRATIEQALEAAASRPREEVMDAVRSRRRRQRELAAALRAWLDELLPRLDELAPRADG
jgi:hypothetical protein